jgi:leucyl aminopeptidase (aminopeptidase T)
MDRAGKLSHPGWCENLLGAGSFAPGERVLVVVDEPLVEEGAQLLATIRDAGGEPRLELWAGNRPLALPPAPVLEAAQTADLALFLNHSPRADEAQARFELMETMIGHAGRELYLALVDGELLAGELSGPMPDLAAPTEQLLSALAGADTIRVRGAAGTDLTLRVTGRPWKTDAVALVPGEVGNFPGGEIFVAPHADGADGVLVVDLTIPYTVDGFVDEPVTILFEGGRATSIEGGRAGQILRGLVADAGKGADVIAELGIGLNTAIAPRGHTMLDEKAAGTAHVAIGRNTGAYGGDNEATIHVDCIFSNPQFEADGRPVPVP